MASNVSLYLRKQFAEIIWIRWSNTLAIRNYEIAKVAEREHGSKGIYLEHFSPDAVKETAR